jgi:hypothetical protein
VIISFEDDEVVFQELVELIQQFPISTAFFQWLVGDDLVVHVVTEDICEGIFERVSEYYIHDLKVFSGGGQFCIESVEKNCHVILPKDPRECYIALSKLPNLRRSQISDLLTSSHFTLISQFYFSDQPCGGCWEIYDMQNLLKVYKSLPSLLIK